jgi:hypothetical protein
VPQHEVAEHTRHRDGHVARRRAHSAALLLERALELDQALFDAFPLLLGFLAGKAQSHPQLVAERLELGDLGIRRGRWTATGA